MAKYPKPIPLDPNIRSSRALRSREIIQAAKWGMGIRIGIILFELAGVAMIQSSALFLDAVSSLLDVISTLFLIVCIRIAKKPPDRNHPFGHGRFEPLGGFFLGLMLIGVGGLMTFQQLVEVSQEQTESVIHPLAWVFPVVAMLLLELAYRTVIHIAKKQKSTALASDAVHYRVDCLSSFFAALALVVAFFYPEWSHFADHMGAMSIAAFMIFLGFAAARDNFNQLVDKAPEKEYFQLVKKAALTVSGVQATEKVKI
ncbi:MAG: cation diffusion facilitator family transporter, partial [Parachlamydia sp.]|nr:cation diffusion facilitator family transporter [Parachlamydia sp.]